MSYRGLKRKRGEQHPYLSGNFAPVTQTHVPTPCSFTGTIPSELLGGEYVRNGGNPVSNSDLGRDAHWFDGDGMLSGVIFERSADDTLSPIPHFVNQYILTDLYLSSLENHLLRTPILPSITTLVNPVSSLIVVLLRIFRAVLLVFLSHLPGNQQVIKRISVANTNILFHDGRALATCESGPPIRIQLPELDTVGWYDGHQAEGERLSTPQTSTSEPGFGGTGLLSWMKEWTTGHPKTDPDTGEMVLFHCTSMAPYVHYSVIPATHSSTQVSLDNQLPKLLNIPVPGVSGGKMMHDFGVSRQHTVIMDLPLSLGPLNLVKNQPFVSFDPEKPSRFGVFPRRNPSQIQWFETKGCCIFHTANTWDELDSSENTIAVNLLACRLTSATTIYAAGNIAPPQIPSRRKEVTERKPISFFASYDGDEAVAEHTVRSHSLQPDSSHGDPEKIPLISHPSPSHLFDDDEPDQCRLYHYRFSLVSPNGTPIITSQYALSALPFEFPTLNPAYSMDAARYIYGCSTRDTSFTAALGKATKIDALVKIDVQTLMQRALRNPPRSVTGCVDQRGMSEVLASNDPHDPIQCFAMPPGWYAQEAQFVPRSNPKSEEDGYLLFYAFDEAQLDAEGECGEGAVSELWILDAKSMTDVVARVKLPARVPYGLHGTWFPEGQIQGQRGVESVRAVKVLGEEKSGWDWIRRQVSAVVG